MKEPKFLNLGDLRIPLPKNKKVNRKLYYSLSQIPR